MSEIIRCDWAGEQKLYQDYHDHEWGIPEYDPGKLFAMLCLEGAQAGLSWWTILQKRAHYYQVFDDFSPEKIAVYDDEKIAALLADPGIVRNRLKVHGFVKNARAWLALQEKTDPVAWLWEAVDGKPLIHHRASLAEVPAVTPQAEALSKRLKKAGFTFVGPTICYAFMQAVGMVNDHLTTCFCHPDQQETTE